MTPEPDDRDRLLTLDEAATLTGHSKSWVRYRRQWGPLEPAHLDGRQAVTARSVERYLTKQRAIAANRRPRRRAPKLHLVWSNPSK